MRIPLLLPSFALAAAAFAFGPACTQDTCSVDPRRPTEPVPAVECPSGDVCYRGACFRSCSAGREAAGDNTCESNDDCSGARGNCVETLQSSLVVKICSACEAGERCVPVLDICQRVDEVPRGDEPPRPPLNAPRPPGPRDAGVLDAGLVRGPDESPDAGQVNLPLTRTVFVDVAKVEVRTNPALNGDRVEVASYDVRGNSAGLIWRTEFSPPRIEVNVESDADCELNRLEATTATPTSANFGVIRIGDFNTTRGVTQEVVATFDDTTQRYGLDPNPIPQPLVTLSNFDTLESTFITVTGEGLNNVTDSSWPMTEVGLHVPFDLRLETASEADLASTISLGAAPNPVLRDISMRFNRVGTGVVATERIVLRVPGQNHEILCQQPEGPSSDNQIVVRAGLLERFRTLEAPAVGARYPLIIERASAERLQVNPDPMQPDERLFVSVRVRHSLEGEISF